MGTMLLEKLFGSQTRAALLKTLFSAEARKVHLRELARLTGLSAPNLMREAKTLAREGILVEEKDGNRVLYAANPICPFHGALKDIVAKATDGAALLKGVFSQSAAKVVFIYGSRASGTARADSDYDIFCIGDEGLRKVTALLAPVRDALGVELNPYVISEGEFKERLASGNHFIKEVMASGKLFLKGGPDELKSMEG
jgi:DNA-binding transcriptional ArsR family regulator